MDIRSLLENPAMYRLFFFLSGTNHAKFVQQYVRPKRGDTVLDIGCGPADILEYLPDVNYVGFDASQAYIDAAVNRYKERGSFFCSQITNETASKIQADIVLAAGVLHHLNDQECISLFTLAYDSLKRGGRLITMDGCYAEGQSWLARYVVSKDRGRYIRRPQQYRELAEHRFSKIIIEVRSDLIRLPYTHAVMECTK